MYSAQIPLDVNPQVAVALEPLGILLDDYHYSAHARARILAYTAREGTPSGCPELDAEDEHDCEMVYVEAFGPVPYDDPAWDDETMCLDVGLLARGVHPWPIPAVGDDDRAEPTEDDLADYGRWSEELDRRRDSEDYLTRFNAERQDWTERPA
jgi:hypothetical protein